MNNQEEKQTPLGILLIFTLWIMISTYFFSLLPGFKNSPVALMIILMIATLFIFLGWGLISFNKWAYFVSFGISIIGAFLSIFSIPALLIMAFISEGFIFIFLIFLCFIPTPFYLYKKRSLYYTPINKYIYEQQTKERICTKCFKTVPWDSKICPYCGYKYENYI